MLLGLRTVIYHVSDLPKAKAWFSKAFGVEPYFDEPFYVGFSVGGYELGLDPNGEGAKRGPGSDVAYWGTRDIDEAVSRFVAAGAKVRSPAKDVGEGIKVATLETPFGHAIGLIENPHFKPEPV